MDRISIDKDEETKWVKCIRVEKQGNDKKSSLVRVYVM